MGKQTYKVYAKDPEQYERFKFWALTNASFFDVDFNAFVTKEFKKAWDEQMHDMDVNSIPMLEFNQDEENAMVKLKNESYFTSINNQLETLIEQLIENRKYEKAENPMEDIEDSNEYDESYIHEVHDIWGESSREDGEW